MLKNIIQKILFKIDPEKSHELSFTGIRLLSKLPFLQKRLIDPDNILEDPRLAREVFGLKFKHPVGLAAGFDKDAKLYKELGQLGFSFVEIGTVTPKGQSGNPRKRLFRLVEDFAIINRMGFNNDGVEAAKIRLLKREKGLIIGGNIGKNKITPNDKAVEDYLACFEALFEVVDYFVVNVSSPNTPNLRDLQEKAPLLALLKSLQAQNLQHENPKPILLKIAPDLSESQLKEIVEIIDESHIAGIIATNTTIQREGLKSQDRDEMGGLSGAPLTKRSLEVVRFLAKESGGRFPIIGVGGIMSTKDALDQLDAGASLVQLYSGFIYEGPQLIEEINRALLTRLEN
ncbi:quinone-dependent dihydroorotate dehydrogenase [Ignatzschineria rhizosphaerae]|uniref:Dihydroorotate dehydrogenase (quinone) n=1 Tax=Ignatzschineria rhizosphaerae TaxID=2923279 RepID=A0ABY3X243_9GAMM|nr:quinone-dependent dihydroorotate dehydrogenase [Ignatzschineria rhizosphaerae]UNM95841.1 quinone-dependent dihydroorotate dehydrogenase [Ignatzschineria rhizosphaerae]